MKSKTYAMQFRRKRAGRTDYRRRLKLLISRKPRVIVRKTLHNFIAQVADYSQNGDLVKVSANSSELRKHGWNYSKSNLSAAYLTGFLLGQKAKKAGIKEAIPDIGMHESKKGVKIYAAIKGAADAGLMVPFSPEIMPSAERIEGKHIALYAKKLKEDQQKYKKQFSEYIKNNTNPENMPEDFKKVKDTIMKVQ